jgi:regulator of protease activity HflC (stomatin/prohibitin superfamily)
MTMLSTLIVALLAVLLASAVRRVPEGLVYSVYRHGKPRRLLPAGTHLVLPLLDRVAHKINLSGQTLQLQAPLGVSDVRGTVYWQVLEPERADAVFEQVDQLIRHGAQAVLRERGMMVTRVDLDAA